MNIILLCGSSCSGKTFIRDNILINNNANNVKFNNVTQVTTRAPRVNEEKSNSYIFYLKMNMMNIIIQNFLLQKQMLIIKDMEHY